MIILSLYAKYSGTKVNKVSIFAGFAGFVGALLILPDIADRLNFISGTMASIGGTLFGFMVTSLSILSAVIDRRLVVNMKKTGHYDQLVRELFYASIVLLLVLVTSLICLFLKAPVLIYMASFSIGFMVSSVGLLIVAGYHFYLVMIHIK